MAGMKKADKLIKSFDEVVLHGAGKAFKSFASGGKKARKK